VWARGLKHRLAFGFVEGFGSRPVWARGLKLDMPVCDMVDFEVAPRVGAWIETSRYIRYLIGQKSRPVWARGLKRWYLILTPPHISRAPCGRVD